MDPNEPFYLYQTPPIQKITENKWNERLDTAECVPSALFYFALDNKIKETITGIYLRDI